MRAAEIPNFEQLSDQERLALAEEILCSVRTLDTLPPPASHRIELDRRWASYVAQPSSALTKDQFRARVAALRK